MSLPVPADAGAAGGVHPLIRVVCFLVFAAYLAFGGLPQLAAGAVLALCAYLLLFPAYFRAAGVMVYRLRRLLLSLLIVYGWFTPGTPLFAAQHSWMAAVSPSIEGAQAGGERVASLILIVMAVNALLRSTPREELLLAIYRLAVPLRVVGLSRERLAVRMVLVMEAVGQVRELVSRALEESRARVTHPLRAAGEFASRLMTGVRQRAEQQPCGVVTLAVGPAPHWLQWLYPIGLWAVLYAAGRIV